MTLPVSYLVTKPQREAIERTIARALAGVRIPAPQTLSTWADEHFYLSPESSAIEGRWQSLPFQRDIMDCIGNDDIRIIDWLKSARVGYTKILMASAAYFIAHKKRSGAIYQPTDSDAREFAKSEVDPMIRDVGVLRSQFKADPEKRHAANTQDLKQFYGAFLYLRGGHSARNYRRLTVDWVFYDELEAFERDVDNEGSAISLGDARITNSPFPKSVRGSTPRLKLDSLIAGEASRAKLYFRYYVHCLDCEAPQYLIFGQMRWDKGDASSVRYECERCKHEHHFADLPDLLEGGFWGTDSGYSIRDGDLVDPDELAVDWPRHVAFHIWAAYSPFFAWSELIEEWLEASDAQKAGDVRRLKTFTNTRLAELWEDEGEQVDYDRLYTQRESYARPPAEVLLLTAQVDVQANRLEGEIVGWARGSESWGVEYFVIWGDTTQPEVWEDLEAMVNQHPETEDGRHLEIAAVVIDSGFNTDYVYRFYKRTAHRRVFVIKGMSGEDRPIVSAPQQRKSGHSKAAVPLFLMGSDVCKAIVYKRLQIPEPGAGYCHFPDTYDEEYFRGLTAERRVLKHRRGFERYEWQKVRPRNEPLDIRAMGVLAIEILNPVWEALDPSTAPDDPDDTDKPAEPYIPHAHRRPRVRPQRGFVDRWRR